MVALRHLTQPGADDVVTALHEDGAVILEGLLASEQVGRLRGELEPLVNAVRFGGGFGGRLTQRAGGLVASAPACRALVMHELILAAASAYLARWTEKLLLHLTQAISIHPGQSAQLIHRDRLGWGSHLPREIEPQLNLIWAVTEFTVENGATRVVPGSHRWSDGRKAKEGEIATAEMAAGSVLVYSGSVLHSGGENRSQACRLGLNIGYCLSWLRQEENQYLSCPPEIARQLDPALQALLGYTMSDHGLGCFSVNGNIVAPEAALGRPVNISGGNLLDYVERSQ